jgi:hypothetical protein
VHAGEIAIPLEDMLDSAVQHTLRSDLVEAYLPAVVVHGEVFWNRAVERKEALG